MANEKKMTEKEFLTAVIEMATEGSEVSVYATEKLNKLNEKASKPTKAQLENKEFAKQLLELMKVGEIYCASDVVEMIDEITSSSKATAVLKVLVAKELVEVSDYKPDSKRTVKGYMLKEAVDASVLDED